MAVIGLLAITACEKTEAPDFVEDSEAEKLSKKLETYQQKMERRRLRQEAVRKEQELQKAQEKLIKEAAQREYDQKVLQRSKGGIINPLLGDDEYYRFKKQLEENTRRRLDEAQRRREETDIRILRQLQIEDLRRKRNNYNRYRW